MNEDQNIDNLVTQIKSYLAIKFNLPENADVVDDIKMKSELHRILSIPNRLSYLAKGIIATSTRDEAKSALSDVLKLSESVNKSDACKEAKERTIEKILDNEIDTIISVLGLTVEENCCCCEKEDASDRKVNIIKRKASDDEGDDVETEIADGSFGSVIK